MKSYIISYIKNNGVNSPNGVVGDYDPIKGLELAPDLVKKYPKIKRIQDEIEGIIEKIENNLNSNKIKKSFKDYRINIIMFDAFQTWFKVEIIDDNKNVYNFELNEKLEICGQKKYTRNITTNLREFFKIEE